MCLIYGVYNKSLTRLSSIKSMIDVHGEIFFCQENIKIESIFRSQIFSFIHCALFKVNYLLRTEMTDKK